MNHLVLMIKYLLKKVKDYYVGSLHEYSSQFQIVVFLLCKL